MQRRSLDIPACWGGRALGLDVRGDLSTALADGRCDWPCGSDHGLECTCTHGKCDEPAAFLRMQLLRYASYARERAQKRSTKLAGKKLLAQHEPAHARLCESPRAAAAPRQLKTAGLVDLRPPLCPTPPLLTIPTCHATAPKNQLINPLHSHPPAQSRCIALCPPNSCLDFWLNYWLLIKRPYRPLALDSTARIVIEPRTISFKQFPVPEHAEFELEVLQMTSDLLDILSYEAAFLTSHALLVNNFGRINASCGNFGIRPQLTDAGTFQLRRDFNQTLEGLLAMRVETTSGYLYSDPNGVNSSWRVAAPKGPLPGWSSHPMWDIPPMTVGRPMSHCGTSHLRLWDMSQPAAGAQKILPWDVPWGWDSPSRSRHMSQDPMHPGCQNGFSAPIWAPFRLFLGDPRRPELGQCS
ncbi:hypothetical protein DFH07DRAFT_767272 [Mycena maculata]|uniref:Uncharacterized protein n=1 Tax=Mycena maculata TaxID=230809 RepID=A0AAD7JYM1_9AGAR|nr:hypothetical protein DFH07DRAFT_767272 [Mycena maculata]